jgi:glutamate-1-semialdehyde 2,1-aminomutase
METGAQQLGEGLDQLAGSADIPLQVVQVGTMFSAFFTDSRPRDWGSVKECDTERFGQYFRAMLSQGVYLAPSQFEAGFFSARHGEGEVEATLKAAEVAFDRIA